MTKNGEREGKGRAEAKSKDKGEEISEQTFVNRERGQTSRKRKKMTKICYIIRKSIEK